MKKKAHHFVHTYCDLHKASRYYKWGFAAAFFGWAIRWVVIFIIAARVIEQGDGLADIFEKAYNIVTQSHSVWLIAAFLTFHTFFGAVKWLGLAYGAIGLGQRRNCAGMKPGRS